MRSTRILSALIALTLSACGSSPKVPRNAADGVLDLQPHPFGVGVTYAVGSKVPFTVADECQCNVLGSAGPISTCSYDAVIEVGEVTLPSSLSLVSKSASTPTGAMCPERIEYGSPPAQEVPATVVVSADAAGSAEVKVAARMSDGSSRTASYPITVVEPATSSFLFTCDDPGTRLDVEPRAVEPLLVETRRTFELRARLEDATGASTNAVGFLPFTVTPGSFAAVGSVASDGGLSDVLPENVSLTVGATAQTGTLAFTVADRAVKRFESFTPDQLTEIRAVTNRQFFTYPIGASSSVHQTVVVAGLVGARAVCFTRQPVRATSRTPSICAPSSGPGADGGAGAVLSQPFFDVFTHAAGTCVLDVMLERVGARLTSTLTIEVK